MCAAGEGEGRVCACVRPRTRARVWVIVCVSLYPPIVAQVSQDIFDLLWVGRGWERMGLYGWGSWGRVYIGRMKKLIMSSLWRGELGLWLDL